jgi:hypothetical protein
MTIVRKSSVAITYRAFVVEITKVGQYDISRYEADNRFLPIRQPGSTDQAEF